MRTRLGSAEPKMRATRAAGLALSTGTYTPPALRTARRLATVRGVLLARTQTRSPSPQPDSCMQARPPIGVRLELAVRHALVAHHERAGAGIAFRGPGQVVLQSADHVVTISCALAKTTAVWARSSSQCGTSRMNVVDAEIDVVAQHARDPVVAADQVGAERLVVLERSEPVGVGLAVEIDGGLPLIRQLAVPVRVGDRDGEAMSDLAAPVRGEARVRDAPCLFGGLACHDADADAEPASEPVPHPCGLLARRLGVLDGGRIERPSRVAARWRRAGHEDVRQEVRPGALVASAVP